MIQNNFLAAFLESRVLQWNPSKPATLGTSESVLIRGVAGEFVLKSMLWDLSKWPEYRGGHISGVLIRGVPGNLQIRNQLFLSKWSLFGMYYYYVIYFVSFFSSKCPLSEVPIICRSLKTMSGHCLPAILHHRDISLHRRIIVSWSKDLKVWYSRTLYSRTSD